MSTVSTSERFTTFREEVATWSFDSLCASSFAAVHAACSLSWSNGIVEGYVNRLKFLKRQKFGRAHLDLLRVKVLHAV
jgi:transposase